MEGGVVKEFDAVPRLMGRSESTFRGMVVEAGLEGAAAGAMSRITSAARLAAAKEGEDGASADGSPPAAAAAAAAAAPSAPASGSRPLMGMKTFVRKMQNEYDLK